MRFFSVIIHLGLIMTITGPFSRSTASAIVPRLGVVPPSRRSAQSSIRPAPLASATSAASTDSTATSRRGIEAMLARWDCGTSTSAG